MASLLATSSRPRLPGSGTASKNTRHAVRSIRVCCTGTRCKRRVIEPRRATQPTSGSLYSSPISPPVPLVSYVNRQRCQETAFEVVHSPGEVSELFRVTSEGALLLEQASDSAHMRRARLHGVTCARRVVAPVIGVKTSAPHPILVELTLSTRPPTRPRSQHSLVVALLVYPTDKKAWSLEDGAIH
ncbi:hypothetical protein HPB51_021145 [Rhipicephalus microplus]|uniref:Uncharacterized protein n=1 Tax=Rhipicephalus microplus TaxID=6941 RepID=A0A9J6DWF4_RHIMP|nr:hypothetical protein HPB51_021145 [Rhipicephalus microplus]